MGWGAVPAQRQPCGALRPPRLLSTPCSMQLRLAPPHRTPLHPPPRPQGMALAESLAQRVAQHGGAALIMDYGQVGLGMQERHWGCTDPGPLAKRRAWALPCARRRNTGPVTTS